MDMFLWNTSEGGDNYKRSLVDQRFCRRLYQFLFTIVPKMLISYVFFAKINLRSLSNNVHSSVKCYIFNN